MASMRKRRLQKQPNKCMKKSKLLKNDAILSSTSEQAQQYSITDEEDVQSSYQILIDSLPSKSKYKLKEPIKCYNELIESQNDCSDDDAPPSCEEPPSCYDTPPSCKEPFSTHFDYILEEKQIDIITNLYSQPLVLESIQNDLGLIQLLTTPIARTEWLQDIKPHPLQSLHIRQPMATTSEGSLTPTQYQLFNIMNTYKDVLYTNRTNAILKPYILHVLNHVIKSRSRVLKNNTRLDNNNDDCHDQGITRPKVLILVPFRSCAVKIIETMSSIMFSSEKGEVANKKRFMEEYGATTEATPPNYKPKSYTDMFNGNTDDCFKMGVSVKKHTVSLYKKFYSCDIIMASPLGLRMIIGGDGDKERDYDYLSSLEIIIADQMDVYLMQNWDHVLHIFNHIHIQPNDGHGVDFSRVREWALNGNNRFYCQRIFISSFLTPEINSLMMKYFNNYEGQVRISSTILEGSVRHIMRPIPQIFYRFKSLSCKDIANNRFDFFVDTVLPKLLVSHMDHSCIYIPSYYDLVRIRNHLKKEEIEFTMMSEYTKPSSLSRAKSFFANGKKRLLLITERLHFFRRYRIDGIHHLVFYGLPTYNEFYSELINMMESQYSNTDVTVVYCQYDILALQRIVGTKNVPTLLKCEDYKQTIITGRE